MQKGRNKKGREKGVMKADEGIVDERKWRGKVNHLEEDAGRVEMEIPSWRDWRALEGDGS